MKVRNLSKKVRPYDRRFRTCTGSSEPLETEARLAVKFPNIFNKVFFKILVVGGDTDHGGVVGIEFFGVG